MTNLTMVGNFLRKRLGNDVMGNTIREMFSEEERVMALLAMIGGKAEEILHTVKKSQTELEISGNEGGVISTVDLTNELRVPMIVTAIVASWHAGSATAGQLVLGKRTIYFPSSTNANNNLQGIWQIAPHDPIILTTTTSAALGLSIMGYADYRKIDRQ